MGSTTSCAAALEELASTAPALPTPSAATAVSAVVALLDSAAGYGEDLREHAVTALAALASSDAARPSLAQEADAVVPHLCRALESGSGASATKHACTALLPLTASSRDACAAMAVRGGVAALLSTCADRTSAAQAAATGVLHNLATFPDLLPAFRDEGGTPRKRSTGHGRGNLTATSLEKGSPPRQAKGSPPRGQRTQLA
ncbi:unnamed protein product [Miscanthus lutarioriparius]|uniref:Uncharacterized protein n=1 Tax=Miscanthus lutarioriparius TaxID=422564 RepID=A0A811QU87_9POAL|nr:unnamed protein product [Miscanthus lutarioriparius]